MNLNHRIIEHIASTTCVELNQICTPLFKIGIRVFMFMRIYFNDTGFALSSDPDWHQLYLENFYKLQYPKSIQFAKEAQGRLIITQALYPDIEELDDANEFYDFGNAICLVRNFPKCKELSYFSANKKNMHIINYYINNVEYLECFMSYFKDKAAKIIQQAEKTKVPLPKEYLKNTNKSNIRTNYDDLGKNLISDIESNKIFIFNGQDEIYLTRQQISIIKWLVKGKTAEEISIILSLSKRTVEEHVNNIKVKFDCYKITQLIYKIGKMNIPID